MGIDFSRVATSALQAALEDGHQPEAKQHHRRLTAGKAIIAGAAVAVAAKYAVDKTSPLKRKAAMATLRHTARNTLGDLVPESLHDKLMDSGFFDQDDEGVGVKDFNQSEDSESEDQDVADEGEGGEESEGQDFFDEPEDEQGDEPEDDVDEDDEPEEDEGDEPDDEPEDDAKAGPEDDVHEDDEPHDDDGARRANPG
jgi:hypothetical protein